MRAGAKRGSKENGAPVLQGAPLGVLEESPYFFLL